jgi:predicted enzyme related to lactoylglutathione lyase
VSTGGVALRVCIDVPDLERAIAFYRDAIGLTVGRRVGQAWVELLGAPVPVDLLAKASGTPATPGAPDARREYARHWTPVHLDVVVADVVVATARAVAAGAALERPIEDAPWGRMANLADPFGHGLCLLEFRGRGYDEVVEAADPSRRG